MANNNIQPYQGPIKDNFDWYDKEQEKTLREKLGDKLFEWLDREVKKKLVVYAFEKNPCFYESMFETVSLHFTKAGAYKAMRQRKVADYEAWWKNRYARYENKYPDWEIYRVRERFVE